MFFLQILLTSFVTGTQVLLLAAGLYLIYALTRIFHIALGAIMATGGYGYYLFYVWGQPAWICFLGGVMVASVFGLISYGIFQPFIKREQGLLGLIASISLGTIIEALIAIRFGSDGKFLTEGVLPTFYFGDLRVTQVGLLIIIVGLITALTAYIFLYLLPYGRSVRALAQHKECASIIGIPEKKVQLTVFILTAAIAGTIGVLTGINNAITPFAGFEPITMAFIALLVGGVTDFKGTVAASYILVLLPQIFIAGNFNGVSFSESWKMVFAFLLALILLLLRPNGIFRPVTRKL